MKRLERVDEVLVVLDDVSAATREGARHLDEPADGHAARLERGGEQRAAVDAGERPHAGHAVPGTVEGVEHAAGNGEVHEPHAGHHRDVAEHQVDERRHAPRLNDRRVVAQPRARGASCARADVDSFDLSHDARRQAGGVRQRLRHLHRLLQGDGGGEGVRGACGVVKIVGGDDTIADGPGRIGHGRLDSSGGCNGTCWNRSQRPPGCADRLPWRDPVRTGGSPYRPGWQDSIGGKGYDCRGAGRGAVGFEIHTLLAGRACIDDLGEHFGAGLHAVEVEHLVEHEWARTTYDILWRRTKRGLRMPDSDVKRLCEYLGNA